MRDAALPTPTGPHAFHVQEEKATDQGHEKRPHRHRRRGIAEEVDEQERPEQRPRRCGDQGQEPGADGGGEHRTVADHTTHLPGAERVAADTARYDEACQRRLEEEAHGTARAAGSSGQEQQPLNECRRLPADGSDHREGEQHR